MSSIRNIAIIAHVDHGKTTLVDKIMYHCQLFRENENTGDLILDNNDLERERGITIVSKNVSVNYKGTKINIIDTPGFDDFIGEVASSVRVADTCVMVINAQHGVEVGTELIWDYVDQFQKPTLFAINQIDHPKADFDSALASLKERYGSSVTQMQYPVTTGEGFNAIIDLLRMVMYKFPPEGGKPQKLQIPDGEKEKADHLHNALVEKAAENDEKLMEKFFDKGTLDEDEMREGLKLGSTKIHSVATETAASLLQFHTYLRDTTDRLVAMTWGAEDLAAALGASDNRNPDSGQYDDPYLMAKSLCLSTARALGIQPVGVVYVNFRDLKGLEADCLRDRRSGFVGKIAIHPDQAEVINRAFTPTRAHIDTAAWQIASSLT